MKKVSSELVELANLVVSAVCQGTASWVIFVGKFFWNFLPSALIAFPLGLPELLLTQCDVLHRHT